MIIGITGRRGNGKSTIAKLIMEMYPEMDFKLLSFPLPLKKVASKMFGITLEQLETIKDSTAMLYKDGYDYPISIRRILQDLGEFARSINQDYFLNEMKKELGNHENVIIADLRFLNEAAIISSFNDGYIIKVKRDIPTNNDNHPTEKEVDSIDADFLIQNSGTIDDLREGIQLAFKRFQESNAIPIVDEKILEKRKQEQYHAGI